MNQPNQPISPPSSEMYVSEPEPVTEISSLIAKKFDPVDYPSLGSAQKVYCFQRKNDRDAAVKILDAAFDGWKKPLYSPGVRISPTHASQLLLLYFKPPEEVDVEIQKLMGISPPEMGVEVVEPRYHQSMHYYVWDDHENFLITVHAASIEEAKKLALVELEHADTYEPTRFLAREFMERNAPLIFHGAQASFVCCGSAKIDDLNKDLEEADEFTEKLMMENTILRQRLGMPPRDAAADEILGAPGTGFAPIVLPKSK